MTNIPNTANSSENGANAKITFEPITAEHKALLFNLLEKYMYEFSQYNGFDTDADGNYNYDGFERIFSENGHYPYAICCGGKPAGFVIVWDKGEYFYIEEFFVMYKYKRLGLGKKAAEFVFGKFRGEWELSAHPENEISIKFWTKIVSDYTNGEYKLSKNQPCGDCNVDVFRFNTNKR